MYCAPIANQYYCGLTNQNQDCSKLVTSLGLSVELSWAYHDEPGKPVPSPITGTQTLPWHLSRFKTFYIHFWSKLDTVIHIHLLSQSTDNDNVMTQQIFRESWVTIMAPMSFRRQKSVGSNSWSTFLFQITYQITMHLLLLSSLLVTLASALPQTCETKTFEKWQ